MTSRSVRARRSSSRAGGARPEHPGPAHRPGGRLARQAAALALVGLLLPAAGAVEAGAASARPKQAPRAKQVPRPKQAPRPAAAARVHAVRLTWARPAGVRTVRVERRDLTAGQARWRVAGTVRGSRKTVYGLRATHRYRFRLRFRATKGRWSRPGASVSIVPNGARPGQVEGLRLKADGTSVVLDWPAARGASGYRVERVDQTTGAVQVLRDSSVSTARSDVPPAALAGRWLAYRVVATDGNAQAAASGPVEARAAGIPAYRNFYALGDSYAAGTGLGQPYDDQQCARSNRMWAALIPRALVPAPSLIACSGAKTVDVRLSAEGGVPQHADLGGTQLDLVRGDLAGRPGPTLITLSIGGNDALFVPQFTRCVTGDCTADRETETALIRGQVRRDLDATFDQIRRVAPAADVLVAGYPRLFSEDPLPRDPIFALTLTLAERKLANVWAEQVNEEVAASARAHGLHPVTDEVMAAFVGHGAGGAEPWINPVLLADPATPIGQTPALPATESIHPTAPGNQAYADVMTAALQAYAERVRVR